MSTAVAEAKMNAVAIAHGRLDQWRSPLFASGKRNREVKAMAGKKMMIQFSLLGGMSARMAKYQIRYQSGLGLAGVAGFARGPSACPPMKIASATIVRMTTALKTASLKTARGKNGSPSSWRMCWY